MLLFANAIGFVHQEKTAKLHKVLRRKAPVVSNVVWSTDATDVYDFSLNDETHWGVVEGVLLVRA